MESLNKIMYQEWHKKNIEALGNLGAFSDTSKEFCTCSTYNEVHVYIGLDLLAQALGTVIEFVTRPDDTYDIEAIIVKDGITYFQLMTSNGSEANKMSTPEGKETYLRALKNLNTP